MSGACDGRSTFFKCFTLNEGCIHTYISVLVFNMLNGDDDGSNSGTSLFTAKFPEHLSEFVLFEVNKDFLLILCFGAKLFSTEMYTFEFLVLNSVKVIECKPGADPGYSVLELQPSELGTGHIFCSNFRRNCTKSTFFMGGGGEHSLNPPMQTQPFLIVLWIRRI